MTVREDFEAWAFKKGWANFRRDEESWRYVIPVLESLWEAWNAALENHG